MEKMTKVQKVKAHIKRNKVKYITGGVCLAVGVTVGVVVGRMSTESICNKTSIANNILGSKNNITNNVTNITQLVRRGHAGNIIRRLEDGKEWASQRQLCSELGIDPRDLWKHLKGYTSDIEGSTFEKVGSFNIDD